MSNEKQNNQLFLLACARGLIEDAQDLVARGVSASTQDKEGRTGAHFAANRGEVEVLKYLYGKGVDLDGEDSIGRAPIHYAALRNHESTVAFLAQHGAWIDACDATDCSPLHLAARSNASEVISRLASLGANIHLLNKWDLTPFGEAIVRGHSKGYVTLAQKGAASSEALQKRTRAGFTILHIVAGAGQVDAISWLLKRPGCPDVNDTKNDEHLTPLHCSLLVADISTDMVKLLVQAGADCTLKDISGRAPLDLLHSLQDKKSYSSREIANIQDIFGIQAKKTRVECRYLEKTQKDCPRSTGASLGKASKCQASLQDAKTPEDVAHVFLHMTEADKVFKIKRWARLPEAERQSIPGLSDCVKACLSAVHQALSDAAIERAEQSLQTDAQFQEDMATEQIRTVVDAVIADHTKGPLVPPGAASTCLLKLRQLRDVLKQHGDGTIYLSRLLRPLTDHDRKYLTELDKKVENLIAETVQSLLGVTDLKVSQVENVQATNTSSTAPEVRANVHTCKTGIEEQAYVGTQPSFWRNTLLQLAVLLIVLGILWWRRELPYQRTSDTFKDEF